MCHALDFDLVCILFLYYQAWYILKEKAFLRTRKKAGLVDFLSPLTKAEVEIIIKLSKYAKSCQIQCNSRGQYLEGIHLWQAALIHCRLPLPASNVSSGVACSIYICMCSTSLSDLQLAKHVAHFGQIHFVIWRNTFCNLSVSSGDGCSICICMCGTSPSRRLLQISSK